MKHINLESIIESKSPGYLKKYPKFISRLLIKSLEKILWINEINQFLEQHKNKRGFEFIDDVFDFLDFSFFLSSRDHQRIPAEGKLICVANHPLGALDGMAILKAIGDIRRDVKIVANDILLNIEPMTELFLPYDVLSSRTQLNRVEGIKTALLNDEAIIFFPAAEVSRLSIRGIRDKRWLNGPLYFAHKYQAPILPIYVKGKNSMLFYAVSLLHRHFSMFLLAREILSTREKTITLKIGDLIPNKVISTNLISLKEQTRLLKKHVYRLHKNKRGVFKTEMSIIHPIDRKLIKNELSQAQLLTVTADGKKLYCVEYNTGRNVMKEISRLREITFRKVGEVTVLNSDFHEYDRHYKHIVLWDEDVLEIIGAYRLGLCQEILQKHGTAGIYNASLFNFHSEFEPIIGKSVELGRSFIQQKYWKSHALDYLWQGIGAFIMLNPGVKYLFGCVSISDNYSQEAKGLIVYFYKKWFSVPEKLVTAKNRFVITKQQEDEIGEIMNSNQIDHDYRNLKFTLKNYGYSIPVLYRQYTELCEKDGINFLDFCVDESFSNTVDGFIVLHLDKLKQNKRKRYFPTETNTKTDPEPETSAGE